MILYKNKVWGNDVLILLMIKKLFELNFFIPAKVWSEAEVFIASLSRQRRDPFTGIPLGIVLNVLRLRSVPKDHNCQKKINNSNSF
jgi:hypothetical protein